MTRPVLLCDDGSDGAAAAVREAAGLLGERTAVVLHVWQHIDTVAFTGAGAGLVPLSPEIDAQLAHAAGIAANEAAERAGQAGFDATPLAVSTIGPTWQTIVDTAREHDAAVIVMGARGLTGLKNVLLGSVSERVVRHADRPVLVIHSPD